MRIKDIPWIDGGGYKFSKGIDLNDAELLSLIFWNGKKGENAVDMASNQFTNIN